MKVGRIRASTEVLHDCPVFLEFLKTKYNVIAQRYDVVLDQTEFLIEGEGLDDIQIPEYSCMVSHTPNSMKFTITK